MGDLHIPPEFLLVSVTDSSGASLAALAAPALAAVDLPQPGEPLAGEPELGSWPLLGLGAETQAEAAPGTGGPQGVVVGHWERGRRLADAPFRHRGTRARALQEGAFGLKTLSKLYLLKLLKIKVCFPIKELTCVANGCTDSLLSFVIVKSATVCYCTVGLRFQGIAVINATVLQRYV